MSTRSADPAGVPDTAVVVGRVGRAHGVVGEVSVDVRTDTPDARFAPGAQVWCGDRVLTVQAARWHHGRLLVKFAGIADRTAAELCRGAYLHVPADQAGDPGADAFWDHQLVGLSVVLADGAEVGQVSDVVHAPGQDLLAVTDRTGRERLVPFVRAVVPEVDLAGGRVVLDPPPGLLDL